MTFFQFSGRITEDKIVIWQARVTVQEQEQVAVLRVGVTRLALSRMATMDKPTDPPKRPTFITLYISKLVRLDTPPIYPKI